MVVNGVGADACWLVPSSHPAVTFTFWAWSTIPQFCAATPLARTGNDYVTAELLRTPWLAKSLPRLDAATLASMMSVACFLLGGFACDQCDESKHVCPDTCSVGQHHYRPCPHLRHPVTHHIPPVPFFLSTVLHPRPPPLTSLWTTPTAHARSTTFLKPSCRAHSLHLQPGLCVLTGW